MPSAPTVGPHGLTFMWWGCFGLYRWHEPAELAHSFFILFVCLYLSMALSIVYNSINSPNNSPLSHSVLPVLFLSYWSFQLYISFLMSLSALIWSFLLTGLKAPTNSRSDCSCRPASMYNINFQTKLWLEFPKSVTSVCPWRCLSHQNTSSN